MHHEQDMRFYGGLRTHIPVTFWAMMAGTLAITGVGVYWLHAGFAGFHSKDAILEAAYASGGGGVSAFWVGTIAALLTSFYSWRLIYLTFFGTPRWAGSEHIQHAVHDAHGHGHNGHDTHGHGDSDDNAPAQEDAGHDPHAHGAGVGEVKTGTAGYHPHESPIAMLVPLVLLTVGAVFAGWVFSHAFLEDAGFWDGSLFYNTHLMHAMHEVPLWVKLSATIAMLGGLLIATLAYVWRRDIPEQTADTIRPLYQFLLHKWYFDELYHAIFVRPAFALGRIFWKRGDEGTIDRFGPNGAAAVVAFSSRVAGRVQSGYVYTYALVMLLGLTAAVTWAITS